MLRQASADVGAFDGGGGGICTMSRTMTEKCKIQLVYCFIGEKLGLLTVLWRYGSVHVSWRAGGRSGHAKVLGNTQATACMGIHFGVVSVAAVTKAVSS